MLTIICLRIINTFSCCQRDIFDICIVRPMLYVGRWKSKIFEMIYRLLFIVWLGNSWKSTSLFVTNAEEIKWFNEVIKFLLRNNDIAIDNFVTLDHPDECESFRLCENAWKTFFEDHLKIWSEEGYIPFLQLVNLHNERKTIPNNFNNSLFILTPKLSNIELLHEQTAHTFAHNSWLVIFDESTFIDNDKRIESIVDNFVNISDLEKHPGFHIDSQVYLVISNGSEWQLFEIYRRCVNSELSIRKLIHADKNHVITGKDDAFIWNRRDNLQGCSIPVAYAHAPPYFQLSENVSQNAIILNGTPFVGKSAYCFQVLLAALNFTPEWKRANDNSFGLFDEEKNEWSKNSIMSLVVNHVAEVSAIELAVTDTRSAFVTFSSQIGFLTSRLYMQRPSSGLSWTTFLDVFSYSYWGLFFLVAGFSITLVTGFMAILSTFNSNFVSGWMERVASSITVVGLGLLDLDADMAVNVDFESPNSMRLLFLSVSFFGLLNKEVYEAGLTSQLTVQKISSPINSLTELASNSRYQILVTDQSADLDYFEEAKLETNPSAAKIYETQILNTEEALVSGVEQAKKVILSDPYKVYFSNEDAINTGVSEYPCLLVGSQKDYFKSAISYPFHPTSHYRKLFNNKINILRETGQYDLIMQQTIREKPIFTCLRDDGGYNELGYKSIFTAYLILASGAIIAACYSILEYLIFR